MAAPCPFSDAERQTLRDLARQLRQIAALPVMAERRANWIQHNAGRPATPPIVVETFPFLGDYIPSLSCQHPVAKSFEWQMRMQIVNHERIDDDKVATARLGVNWKVGHDNMGVATPVHRGTDQQGRNLGFAIEHPFHSVEAALAGLRPSRFSVDREGTLTELAWAQETVGDLLDVRLQCGALTWYFTPSARIVYLMGMERMLTAMADDPDGIRRLYDVIVDDMLAFLDFLERERLLTANHDADYVGSGSYGFSDELNPGTPVTRAGLWCNMNSQETVGVSPAMYRRLVWPAYQRLAAGFGMVYYGCCEPVDGIWESCLRQLPNLRKVSVSAWCNQAKIGAALRGGKVIYSRKPSPNFLGVGDFDPAAFAAHIDETLLAAAGCPLEFIFRDVYTLNGNPEKPRQAVAIVRQRLAQHGRVVARTRAAASAA